MPAPTRFQLDLTGTHPNNRIEDESHTVIDVAGADYYLVVPEHGPFFAQGVVIREPGGAAFDLSEKVKFIHLYQAITERLGLAVYGGLLIKKPISGTIVELTYQALGGSASYSASALKQILEDIDNETNFSMTFDQVINKPDRYPPTAHTHEVWNIYGVTDILRQLGHLEVAEGILPENNGVYINLEDFINEYLVVMGDPTSQQITDMDNHALQTTNPHNVTKFQIGLSQVENYPVAVLADLTTGTSESHYVTPDVALTYIQNEGRAPVDTHIALTGAVHSEGPSDVGTYSTTEFDNLVNAKLLFTEVAVNSDRLGGSSFDQIFNNVHDNIPPSSILFGAFSPARLGSGPADNRKTLRGNSQWEFLSTMLAPLQPDPGETGPSIVYINGIYDPVTLRNDIIGNYSNLIVYPQGTIIVGHSRQTAPFNDPSTADADQLVSVFVAKRRVDGWDFVCAADPSYVPETHEF